jgi:hypothetical protein
MMRISSDTGQMRMTKTWPNQTYRIGTTDEQRDASQTEHAIPYG